MGERTGGCSSFSDSVLSGLADIFANTPSVPEPPPTIRGDLITGVVEGCDKLRPAFDEDPEAWAVAFGVEFCRTSR